MSAGELLVVAVFAAASVLVLVAMVAVRKTRRDRREEAQTQRRQRFLTGLSGDDDARDLLLRESVGNPSAQTDLVAVMTGRMGEGPGLRSLEGYPSLAHDLRSRLDSRSAVQRGTAVLLLAIFHDPASVAAAAAALADKDADVKLVAARSLALMGSTESAKVLLDALRSRPIPPERIIERLAGDWALETCLAALASEGTGSPRDAEFRADIARTLTLIGDPSAEPAMLAMLHTGSTEERVNAARALGRCGTDACVPALEAALADPDDQVRTQAAKALGRLGAVGSIPVLTAAMGDQVWWVRSNAATALGRLGPPGRAALRSVAEGADRFAAQRAAEQLVLLEHG